MRGGLFFFSFKRMPDDKETQFLALKKNALRNVTTSANDDNRAPMY